VSDDGLADAYDQRVLQQLDDLQQRLAEQQRERNVLAARLDDIAARFRALRSTLVHRGPFTAAFRGDEVDIHARYGDLASLFKDCDLVLDIGFGRGGVPRAAARLDIDAMASRSILCSCTKRGRAAARRGRAAPSNTCAACPTRRSAGW